MSERILDVENDDDLTKSFVLEDLGARGHAGIARHAPGPPRPCTAPHREPVAPWRLGRMSDVSTLRIRLESGMANQVERLCPGPIGPAWRELRACGELLLVPLVRAEGAHEQYDLVTR